jgi:hypothetical protein
LERIATTTVWSSNRDRSATIVVVSPPDSGAVRCTTLPLTRITNTTCEAGSPWLDRVTVEVGGGHACPATLTFGMGTGATQSGVTV